MRRRAACATFAAVLTAGCVGSVPPTGPRNPPGEADARDPDPTVPDEGPPEFRITDWDFAPDDDGGLVVTVTVGNDAPSERSGTVVVEVFFDDDERYEEHRQVTVDGESSVAVDLAFDVAFERFDAGGSARVELV